MPLTLRHTQQVLILMRIKLKFGFVDFGRGVWRKLEAGEEMGGCGNAELFEHIDLILDLF